jgi:hypothetical protein
MTTDLPISFRFIDTFHPLSKSVQQKFEGQFADLINGKCDYEGEKVWLESTLGGRAWVRVDSLLITFFFWCTGEWNRISTYTSNLLS